MTMLRIFEAGALAAALLLGTAAIAEEEPGQSSGPAQGTNVAPSQGPAAAGNPGQPGMPGNKSGPAVYPQRKASAGQMRPGKAMPGIPGRQADPPWGQTSTRPRAATRRQVPPECPECRAIRTVQRKGLQGGKPHRSSQRATDPPGEAKSGPVHATVSSLPLSPPGASPSNTR